MENAKKLILPFSKAEITVLEWVPAGVERDYNAIMLADLEFGVNDGTAEGAPTDSKMKYSKITEAKEFLLSKIVVEFPKANEAQTAYDFLYNMHRDDYQAINDYADEIYKKDKAAAEIDKKKQP